MSTSLVPFEHQQILAASIAKSGLFGIKTPDQALALMALCEAENLHPATAMRDYHIVQGRPALKADAMLARFQAAGGTIRWAAMTEQRVSATFSHPQGGSVEIEWTIDMAKRAGLTKNPTWTQYPRAMLRARCISEGIRTVFPGVVVGTYTPEEVEDMPAAPHAPHTPHTPPAATEMVEEVLTFADIMARIDAARTVDELNALKPAIRELDRDGRAEATDAAKERAAQIRAEAAQTPQEAADDPV